MVIDHLRKAGPGTASPMRCLPSPQIEYLSTFGMGDTLVAYLLDGRTGAVGLSIVPLDAADRVIEHRAWVGKDPAWSVSSLVQLKCVGDAAPDLFRQGRTMSGGASVSSLRYVGQRVEEEAGGTTVLTTLAREGVCRCEHRLSWRVGGQTLECTTTFRNESEAPIVLEMLSSFVLEGITPFAPDDALGRLVVHRLRSAWSAEGRLESLPLERLQMESFGYSRVANTERYGQVGSLPVRGWFPFVAIEDTAAGVLWGAQIAWPGSWQMEISRQDDMVSLNGGLADREFGHWMKTVLPGEAFTTPPAILASSSGDLDTLCARLLSWQEHTPGPTPAAEADLPIVFNEWCTTWGKPTHDNLLGIADTLADSDTRFLVIDAGWYVAHGDWRPLSKAFPQGLRAIAQAIRQRGLIPGLWLELETCHPDSCAVAEHAPKFLTRDGVPIVVQSRWFWDFRIPWVVDHLTDTVGTLLEQCGFGYLKIDYNDTVGIGCDGAESLGEGLRQHLAGVQTFWQRLRARLPGLVIENCASGGHRLEPSMMALADQASFSDAHEGVAIPIIAANVQRAILPRKSQVWAVLRRKDDRRRLVYSLAATFLGRMGLSGDITGLDADQWETLCRAQRFYGLARPVIRSGISRRYGPDVLSYRHPTGWQAVVRHNDSAALVVCHAFGEPTVAKVELALPEGSEWKIAAFFDSGDRSPEINDGKLDCELDGPWSACAVLLKRGGGG